MIATIPTPCKIQMIELANGVEGLSLDDERYRAVGLFFQVHGVPLGHKYLHAAELPLSSEQLWNVAQEAILPAITDYLLQWDRQFGVSGALRLQRLLSVDPIEKFRQGLVSRSSDAAVARSVSVVVCTRERPQALARCLAALRESSDESTDLVVVDNAPATDATRLVVAEFPGVRYKVEARPGLSYARNTGIRFAKGDVIVFTDDDVVVTPNWLEELCRPFSDPAVMCSTGLVIPAELQSREQSFFEHWMTFHRGYKSVRFGREWLLSFRSAAPVWRIGAGASMAIRRTAFEKVGVFDTRLGAGASGCSEDSEFWYRLLAAGYVCEYTPAAVVLHHHRADAASLAQQMLAYSRGHAAALLVQFRRHRHFGNLFRLAVLLPAFYVRKLTASLLIREWRPFWLASAIGHVAGIFYWLRSKQDESNEVNEQAIVAEFPAELGSHSGEAL